MQGQMFVNTEQHFSRYMAKGCCMHVFLVFNNKTGLFSSFFKLDVTINKSEI